MPISMLREPRVLESTGDKRSNFRKKVAEGRYTPPVKIGARAAAWPSDEVEALARARVAGLDETQIRALVRRLLAKRKAVAAELREQLAQGE